MKINVAEINNITYSHPSAERSGYDINITMEPWRIKELIFKLWNDWPDEFEECLKDEGWVDIIAK